jgi:hypothetical protein
MNLFSSKTEECFSFLVTEYGFTAPTSTDGSWKTTFLFKYKQLGIEVELNYEAMDVFIYIVQLENGQAPEAGEEPDRRTTLENVLDIPVTKSNGDETTIEQFEKGIARKAELLEQNIHTILTKSEAAYR